MNPEFIKRFNAELDKSIAAVREKRMGEERNALMATIGQDLAKMLAPFLNQVAANAKASKADLREAMFEIMGQVNAKDLNIDTAPLVDAIQSAMMNVQIPEPKVTVMIDKDAVKAPSVVMPDEMKVRGLDEFMKMCSDPNNPLSVQIRDRHGKPVDLSALSSMAIGVGGGGSARRVKIDNTSSEPIPISGTISATFSADFGSGEIGSETLRTVQATNAVSSVYVTGASGSLAANIVDSSGVAYSGSNPVPITIVSGSSSGTEYANGASKEVPSGGVAMGNTGDETGNIFAFAIGSGVTGSSVMRVVHATDVGMSVSATQVGTWNIGTVTAVTSITNSIAAAIVDSSGVQYSTTNPLPIGDAGGSITIDGTVAVSAVTASIAAALVDSGGVQYSTTNPVPIGDAGGSITIDGTVSVTGSITSTVVTGPVAGDVADDGSAPVQMGGIARQANPTAVAANDVVKATFDDVGRQVMRPVQVRDLVQTAYVSVANGTETTLLAGASGVFLDLIYVMATNNSDAAVTVDLRSETGGGVMTAIRVPANGTAGVSLAVPLPQNTAAGTWTVDLPDITGTTVTVSAIFSKEV